MRLQKFMAEAGVASRRKCEEYIAAGLVKVNGLVATIGTVVDPVNDRIEYNGRVLKCTEKRVVYAYYKPRGVMCTSSDPEGRATIMDSFKNVPYRLYSVGRLDYDSEGLLLMTNDGELAYKLTHPKFVVNKTYHAVCDGVLTNAEIAKLEHGVDIGDGVTSPATVTQVHALHNGNTSFDITIHEGRNRQIRRMLEAVGHQTLVLKRTKEGPVSIGFMQPGEYRLLSEAELAALKGTE
jgi:pseudouridine synthase